MLIFDLLLLTPWLCFPMFCSKCSNLFHAASRIWLCLRIPLSIYWCCGSASCWVSNFCFRIVSFFLRGSWNRWIWPSSWRTRSVLVICGLLNLHRKDLSCRKPRGLEVQPLNYPKLLEIYIYEDSLLQIAAQQLKIFQKVALIQYRTLVSVEDVLYSFLGIYETQHFVCIILETGSKDHKLIELGHFEEKDVKSKPFSYIYLFQLPSDFYLSCKVIGLCPFKRSMDKSLVEI